jgi:hypothetical protein
MVTRKQFDPAQIDTVNKAVAMAEELVSNAYKMSTSQWLSRKFDVRTLAELQPDEVIHGPFAQIVRYEGKRKNSTLGSGSYDFYKICLQDHAILATLKEAGDLALFPFVLYIVIHELVHIVRFTQFVQNFQASRQEMMAEEARVHRKTHDILAAVQVPAMAAVLQFYEKWRTPFEDLKTN